MLKSISGKDESVLPCLRFEKIYEHIKMLDIRICEDQLLITIL